MMSHNFRRTLMPQQSCYKCVVLLVAPGAIPIVAVKQEVKPDLSAAATVEQQELPPAAVTAIEEEVEETPSGKDRLEKCVFVFPFQLSYGSY